MAMMTIQSNGVVVICCVVYDHQLCYLFTPLAMFCVNEVRVSVLDNEPIIFHALVAGLSFSSIVAPVE